MPQRTVGPLPLTAGIQLNAPEASPKGLLRALNVESRDGFTGTRRGQSQVGLTTYESAAVLGYVPQPSIPAVWNGATTVYLSADFLTYSLGYPVPDAIVRMHLQHAVPGYAEFADEDLTYEYWANTPGDPVNGQWLPLEAACWNDVATGSFWSASPFATAQTVLDFVVPYGWRSANPADPVVGGNSPGGINFAYWIRIRRTTAWANPNAVTTWVYPTRSQSGVSPVIVDVVTREGFGPISVSPAGYGPVAGGFQAAMTWNILDHGQPHAPLGEYAVAFAPGVALPANPGDTVCGVYISATDQVLLWVGTKYIVIDYKQAPPVASLFAPEVPDPLLSPYGDIASENALTDAPTCMAIFGGRPFIAGFKSIPQRIQWGAPDEFWTVWPSSNVADLTAFGSGRILAMVPFQESLFIFTTNGIWRAVLANPTDGNESDLFLSVVDNTPCLAGRSVVACGSGIVFLAPDGVRWFNGIKSVNISGGLLDLFRPDSDNPYACLRKDRAVAAWHPLENQYRMGYPAPGAQHNETMVVIDLDDKTGWVWGANKYSQNEVPGDGSNLAVSYQRSRGVRAGAVAWATNQQRLLLIDPENGYGYMDDGDTDWKSKVQFFMETQTLRIAGGERTVVTAVDLTALRDNFKSVKVSVIPDGDRSRADSKTIAIQRDALDTTVADGAASLAGNVNLANLDVSLAPYRARFCKAGRNHRIRVESVAPDHAPARIVAMTVDLSVDERRR